MRFEGLTLGVDETGGSATRQPVRGTPLHAGGLRYVPPYGSPGWTLSQHSIWKRLPVSPIATLTQPPHFEAAELPVEITIGATPFFGDGVEVPHPSIFALKVAPT